MLGDYCNMNNIDDYSLCSCYSEFISNKLRCLVLWCSLPVREHHYWHQPQRTLLPQGSRVR